MSNEELIYDIQANIGNRNEKLLLLFDQNSGMIHKLIAPYLGALEEADLLQYAFLALYPAIDGYDPNKSLFMTYYEYHLKHTLREAIRDNGGSGIPYNLYSLIRKYDDFVEGYRCEHGHKPTMKMICEGMDIPESKVHDIRKAKRALTESRSIDDPIPGADDLILADTLPSNEDIEGSVIDDIERSELEKDMKDAIRKLPEDIRRVIMLYYIQGLPANHIMEAMGMAYNECRRKRERGLTLLKRDARIKRRLKEYRDEHNLYRCGLNGFTNHGSQVENIAIDVLYYERYLHSLEERYRN